MFALSDMTWQNLINGGYACIGAIFVAYLNYKLNILHKTQKDVGTENAKQSEHLVKQDEVLTTIKEQTNGLTMKLVDATSKASFEAGKQAGKEQAESLKESK